MDRYYDKYHDEDDTYKNIVEENKKEATEKQVAARRGNIQKAIETRKEMGKQTKELNDKIRELKQSKRTNLNEEIYNIQKQIENVRYGRKKNNNNEIVDFRDEYFKLLLKYEKVLSYIELEVDIEEVLEDKRDEILEME